MHVTSMSAADTYLNSLQRVFHSASFFTPMGISLQHRRDVAALCLFYKILNNERHPMQSRLPGPIHHARRTRRAARMNSRALTSPLAPNSVQFNRTFVPRTVEMWNFLPQNIVDSTSMDQFKRNVNRHLLASSP